MAYMAFILKQSDTYSWPVNFEIPVDGRHEAQSFDAVFKRMSQTWIRDIAKKIDEGKATDVEVARQVLAGWSGVNDAQGKEIPFSIKALETMLDIPSVAGAVVLAYFNSVTGAKEKN